MERVKTIRVVVASPGDVNAERKALPQIIDDVNRDIGVDRELRLELSMWEKDAFPGVHVNGAQALIDAILKIEDCDIFIGIFWRHFGTPVTDARSGTEHEHKIANDARERAGRPHIMFYFNEKKHSPKSREETDQWGLVLEFKKEFAKKGLWWPYKSTPDFRSLVREHLINHIRSEFPLTPPDKQDKRTESGPATGTARDSNGNAVKNQARAESAKAKRKSPQQTTSNRNTEELFRQYQDDLESTVGKLRIFDEEKARRIESIFVEFNLIETYRRPDISAAPIRPFDRKGWGSPVVSNEGVSDEDLQYDGDIIIRSDELLHKRLQAVIVGAPGSGKTMLLRYLTCRVIRENRRLPIFLELKTITEEAFKQTKGNLSELLFEKSLASSLYLNTSERKQLKKHFLDRLAAGDAAIFLDGLDELRGTSFFTNLCNSIREFVRSAFRHNSLIVSTRPYAWLARFDELKEMEIAPLNKEQIRKFLTKHYGEHPPEQRELQIRRFLKQFWELPRVPFLLAVMVRLDRNQGSIVKNRFNIYKHIVGRLAGRDSENAVKRNQETIDEPDRKVAFLRQLACERFLIDDVPAHESRRAAARMIFTGDLLIEKAKLFLNKEGALGRIDVRHFVRDVKNTPFLREVGDDIYAFAHLTIQEYLAAEELSKHPDCVELFCRAYFDSTLVEMEVLPMTLGLVGNKDEFYAILEQLPESLNFANLRLRIRGLAYTQNNAQNINDERMKKLVDRIVEFLSERNIEESPYARAVLGSISPASGRALDLIVNQLLPLMTPENRHKDIYPKLISVLGSIGDERAVPVLRDLLMNGDSALRARAAIALGEIGGKDAVRALLDASKDRLPTSVRWSAGDALKLIGDERAVRELIKAFNDATNKIRESVAGVLGQIGGELAMKALISALEDSSYQIRANAADALGKIGDEYAVAMLSHVLSSDSSESVRKQAAQALGEIRSSKAAPALIAAMQDRVFYVRQNVAKALGRIGDESAAPALIRATASTDEDLARIATEALGQIGGDQALECLEAALQAKNSATRYNAITALAQIGGDRAIVAMKQALRDKDASVRALVEDSLNLMTNKQNARPPASSQKDEPIGTRKTASDLLLGAGSKFGVARCLETLKSLEIDPRWAVAEALERMSSAELVEGFVNALTYHSAFVRQKAALLVGYYSDDKRTLEVLDTTTGREIGNDELDAILLAQNQFRRKLGFLKLL